MTISESVARIGYKKAGVGWVSAQKKGKNVKMQNDGWIDGMEELKIKDKNKK
jgi:hypothetical protein